MTILPFHPQKGKFSSSNKQAGYTRLRVRIASQVNTFSRLQKGSGEFRYL